jgi:hypothetical protein
METEKVIKHLSELPIESQVIIQWFEKQHVEANAKTSLSESEWQEIVAQANVKLEHLWSAINQEILEIVKEVQNG